MNLPERRPMFKIQHVAFSYYAQDKPRFWRRPEANGVAEGEIHFAAFRLPASRSAAWVKSQLSSTQSDQYPRCATRFPGRLERLLTRATDEKSFLAFAITIFVRVFIGVHAPMGVMVVVTEDLVDENAEAMFLCVI